MDVLPTDEERLLRESLRQFLQEQCPTSLVRSMELDELGYPPELWREMADLGWFGWTLPERYGGSDGTLVQLGIILGEVGRAVAPVPFLSTIIPAHALVLAGSEDQRAAVLPSV